MGRSEKRKGERFVTSLRKPFPRCYWVTDSFLAGCYPGSQEPGQARANLQKLKDCGIWGIIDLTEEDELEPYALWWEELGLAHFRRPIIDMDVPGEVELQGTLDLLDQLLAEGKKVYVHCWGGIGRTGTVVGCWLRRHGWDEPVAEIARLRELSDDVARGRRAPETPAQIKMVKEWKG